MKKTLLLVTVFLVILGLSGLPTLAQKAPEITLDRVEVASIQPFFMNPKIAVPSKEDAKKTEEKQMAVGYSATMSLAYIFNVKNPDKEPVMLDEMTFTTTFDGFDTNTVTAYEDSWIPGGKTNQVRVVAVYEAHPLVLSLMVGSESVERMKEMKTTAGALVKKWFEQISDFSFPIGVTGGTALFKDAKGKEVRVNFTGKWGKPAAAAPEKKEEKKKEGAEKKAEKKK